MGIFMSYNNFLGQDGFIWFTAVVEDRQDPSKLGRVRVRCLGYHTDDKTVLPTADLPWAHVLLPITSSGISGIGHTPTGLLEGSWVFGFFRDALHKQEPVILAVYLVAQVKSQIHQKVSMIPMVSILVTSMN